jgi:hypothetical protein
MQSLRRRNVSPSLKLALQHGEFVLRDAKGRAEAVSPAHSWRSQLVIAAASIPFEHQSSLLYLISLGGHDATASSLLRLTVESMVRVLWINYCASDDQIQQIYDGTFKFENNFPKLVEQIRRDSPLVNLDFSKEFRSWINGLTHAGCELLERRFNQEGEYDPTLPDPELILLITIGSFCIAETASLMCSLSGRQSEAGLTLDLCAQFFPDGITPPTP